ncbi:hypothetical protein IWX49DRAFT_31619 [Phyllosticta citricarpa]
MISVAHILGGFWLPSLPLWLFRSAYPVVTIYIFERFKGEHFTVISIILFSSSAISIKCESREKRMEKRRQRMRTGEEENARNRIQPGIAFLDQHIYPSLAPPAPTASNLT